MQLADAFPGSFDGATVDRLGSRPRAPDPPPTPPEPAPQQQQPDPSATPVRLLTRRGSPELQPGMLVCLGFVAFLCLWVLYLSLSLQHLRHDLRELRSWIVMRSSQHAG